MFRQGMEGWVDMSFNIYPDGSARDIQVIEDMPLNGGFAEEAVKSLEKYNFVFEENGKIVKITEPYIHHTLRIQFKFKSPTKGLNSKQQLFIQNLIAKAKGGDINAQYTYAQLYETYLQEQGEIDAEQVNQWLFNAAQQGIPDAQYRLGKNIYYGKSCEVEKQKGLDWIMHAAQHGDANAEFMAYQLLQNDGLINQANQPPSYWLEQSATNGSKIAQLMYAKEVANTEFPTDEQLNIALGYIQNYADTSFKTIQWYQINALLQDKVNKHSFALKSIKKALRYAKKAGWDLSELKQQKAMIKQHKKIRI